MNEEIPTHKNHLADIDNPEIVQQLMDGSMASIYLNSSCEAAGNGVKHFKIEILCLLPTQTEDDILVQLHCSGEVGATLVANSYRIQVNNPTPTYSVWQITLLEQYLPWYFSAIQAEYWIWEHVEGGGIMDLRFREAAISKSC